MEPCRFCKRQIRFLLCRDGRRRTFESEPRDLGENRRTGFVLVRYRRPAGMQVLATPVSDVADRKLIPTVRVFELHFCPEYAEQRMRVGPADLAWLNGMPASEAKPDR